MPKLFSIIGFPVWVVTGHSESGDDFGPLVFASEPTEEQEKKIAWEWDGLEGVEGPGSHGSYVHLSVEQAFIQK